MKILNKPKAPGPYVDRDIGCQEALEQVFLDVARDLTPDDIKAAAGGHLPSALVSLAKRAEAAGWSLEESETALSDLSQNLLDDMSAM